MQSSAARPLWTYLLLVALFSAPFVALILSTGALAMGRGFVIHSLMWAPALAACASSWRWRRSLEGLGWRWGRARYAVAGYLLPIIYGLLAYVPLWLLGWSAFGDFAAASAKGLSMPALPLAWAALLQTALTLGFGVIQSGASALGEELGWRGYLVPALRERMGFAGTAVVSGLIWTAWHLPVVLFADYNGAAPRSYSVACFAVQTVAVSVIYAWLRLRSGSVWPAVLLHASHNAVIQWLLDPMTATSGRVVWFAGEFGAALAVSIVAVALVLLIARGPPGEVPAA